MAPNVDRSKELFQRAVKSIPGGVCSENRSPNRGLTLGIYPLYMTKGNGSKIYDADGNKYIDYLLGFGPIILGHSHPKVNEAVRDQLENGSLLGLNSELEIKVAEKVVKDVPCAEQVSFFVTGSGATSASIRLARAYTGKEKIAKFDIGYNGWHDWCMVTALGGIENNYIKGAKIPGVPKSVLEDIIILPWNNPETTEKIIRRNENEIAAVVAEPCPCGPVPTPPENDFLKFLKEITEAHDILLIFDEVKTGFRLGLGGGQEFYHVTPDIAVFGKAIANGFPLSAVTSTRDIMKPVAEYKLPFWGTFNSCQLCLAATLATLNELEAGDQNAYAHLFDVSGKLVKGMKDAIEDVGIEAVVKGPAPMPWIVFTHLSDIVNAEDNRTINEHPHRRRRIIFAQELLKYEVFCVPDHPWFVSVSHSKEDIDHTVYGIQEALKEAKK